MKGQRIEHKEHSPLPCKLNPSNKDYFWNEALSFVLTLMSWIFFDIKKSLDSNSIILVLIAPFYRFQNLSLSLKFFKCLLFPASIEADLKIH